MAALYYGRGLLIPFSIALLLFVLLTSVIDRIAAAKIGGRAVLVVERLADKPRGCLPQAWT